MRPLADETVKHAIAWHLQLSAAAEPRKLAERIDQWCAEHPDHALAWQRLCRMQQELGGLRQHLPSADVSISLLHDAHCDVDRRRTIKMLAVAIAVGTPASWLAGQQLGKQVDMTTATGEQTEQLLTDGTRVKLNTDSALDVEQLQGMTNLYLRRGEVLIDSLQSRQPLRLYCALGVCQSEGARFSVREQQGGTLVSVLQGDVEIAAVNQQRRASAGETVLLSAKGIHEVNSAISPDSWTRGMLVVDNIALSDFVDELARYRQGLLGCDPAIASLRLSGVFQLDQPELLLDDLTGILPVRVIRRTRWWVRVVPA